MLLALLSLFLGAALPTTGTLPVPRDADSLSLSRAADSLLEPWLESGHLLAQLRLEGRAPLLSWSVTPGPFLRWRSVQSLGDSVYTPYALSRLSGLSQGAPAAPSSLRAATDRLLATGCAELSGDPQPRGVPGTTWADAWIPLRRIPCSEAEAALGWDQQEGFQGYLQATLANILGTARQASLSASSTPEATRFDVLWKEPWLGSWDAGLDLQFELQETVLEQLRRAMAQVRIPWERGSWILGLETWSDIVASDSTDSASVSRVAAVGSRFGWELSGRRSGWLAPREEASILLTSLQTFRDSRKLLLRGEASFLAKRSFAPNLALQLRGSGRGLWPLDTLSAVGETRSLGGAGSWKGHPEGAFQSPRWIWSEAELRAGTDSWGGALFGAPGVVWLRSGEGFSRHLGWGVGGGFFWSRNATDVRLDLAAGEDTRSWDEAYLHLVLHNRF